MSGALPKHEVAQVAATSHVAAQYDRLRAQIKSWFNMESYATRANVSGRSKTAKGSASTRGDNKTGNWSL